MKRCWSILGFALVAVASFGAVAQDVASASACADGLVWRETFELDQTCVDPASRARVLEENALSEFRVDPQGEYGPFSCMAGYVWREAYRGDAVCVTPARRTAVARENAKHRLGN